MLTAEVLSPTPSQAPWMQVEVIDDRLAFAQLRPEWEALLEKSDASVFNSWDWMYPWVERIEPNRTPWILTARDAQGQLLGLFPLSVERRQVWGRSIIRVAFLGETHVGSDYLDVLALRGHEAAVVRTFAALLSDASHTYDVLDLVDMNAQSLTVQMLQRHFRGAGFNVQLRARHVCPHERLEAVGGFDAFLRKVGRRENYLRRLKWLEAQPGYRIEKTESAEALAPAMAQFFRLHALRWDADGGSQGIRGPSVEGFHRDATEYLALKGKVRLYTMWLNNQALASVYAIRHGGRFLYFQSGYDPAWRSRSVGLVLVGETFKDAIAEGCLEYDFLRGTEGYKAEWTTRRRETVALRVTSPGGRGEWLTQAERAEAFMRAAVKGMLPKSATERIRRLRRRQSRV